MSGCCQKPRVTLVGTESFDFSMTEGRAWKEAFGTSTISCCSPKLFFAARVSFFVFWLVVLVWDWFDWVFAQNFPIQYWFIYLTHWGVMAELVWLYFGMYTTGMALRSSVPDGTGKSIPWFARVTWFLYSWVPLVSFLVFALYWVLVYDPNKYVNVLTYLKHGANFLLAMVDVLLCRQPLNLGHVYVPLLVSALYIGFTYMYHVADLRNEEGKPYIYSSFDWESKADSTRDLAAIILLVVIPATYLLCFGLVRCRRVSERASDRAAEQRRRKVKELEMDLES